MHETAKESHDVGSEKLFIGHMRSEHRNTLVFLITVYFVSVLSKMMLAAHIPTISVYLDEYLYSKMARDILQSNFSQLLDGLRTYPPMYPMLLTPAFALHDMRITYFTVKFINALVISGMIVPVWFLSCKFLDRKEAALLTLVSMFAPWAMIYPCYIMSENLFIPLFLVSVMLEVMIIIRPTSKRQIALGIALALSYLTKYIGVLLFVPLVLLLLIDALKAATGEKRCSISLVVSTVSKFSKSVAERWIVLATFLFFVAPLYIAKAAIYGPSLSLVTGMDVSLVPRLLNLATRPFELLDYVTLAQLFVMTFSYGVIAVGVVLFAASVVLLGSCRRLLRGDWELFLYVLAIVGSYVVFVSMASLAEMSMIPKISLSLFGRYVDPVLPGLAVVGFTGLKKTKEVHQRYLSAMLLVFCLTVTSILSVPRMWELTSPPDSIGINYAAVARARAPGLDAILLVGACVLMTAFYLVRRVSWKQAMPLIGICLLVFFFCGSLVAYDVTRWSAEYSDHELHMSTWVIENDIRNVTLLGDQRFPAIQYVGIRIDFGIRFWAGERNIRVFVGDIAAPLAADYILSADHLGLPVVMSYVSHGTCYYIYQAHQS